MEGVECRIPIQVRITGHLDADNLVRLEDAVARLVASRLAEASRVLGRSQQAALPASSALAHATPAGVVVPSYSDKGAPVVVPVRTPGPPTMGDITNPLVPDPAGGLPAPPRAPADLVGENVRLVEGPGRIWTQIGPGGTSRATSRYSYVVIDGAIHASRYGHAVAAAGNRVEFAGEVWFADGALEGWNAGSGTFRPSESFAGAGPGPGRVTVPGSRPPFDPGRYVPLSRDEPRGRSQLPVFQPDSTQRLRRRGDRSRPEPGKQAGGAPSPARAERVTAGLMLAHAIIKAGLEQISEDKAQRAAWDDFYAESRGLVELLWDRPGEGAALRFGFAHVRHPNPDMAGSTRYLGMQTEIGPPGTRVHAIPGSWGREDRDLNPANVTVEWVDRWIPPIRSASARPAAGTPAPGPAPKPTIAVTTPDELTRALAPLLKKEDFLGTRLIEYELLDRAVPAFPGYDVVTPEARVSILAGLRNTRLDELRTELRTRLTGRADGLEADVRHEQKRLDGFLRESWPFTIRRGDVTLDPHMFDDPRAHLAAARGNLALGAFRHAWASIQLGEHRVRVNQKVMYHYAEGRPYEGPD